MSVISQVTDRVARMRARLLYQYRRNEDLRFILGFLGDELQLLEDAAWQMQSFVTRNVNAATGDLLTLFGKLVGEQRSGGGDTEFRFRVRARIKANKSRGTAEDVYGVFRALIGATSTGVLRYFEGWPAGFTLLLENYSLGASLVDTFAGFLRVSKADGVYGVFEFYEGVEDQALRFEVAAFLSADVLAGVTTLPVYSTDGFEATGSLTVDTGTADQEVVTYTGITPTSFTGVSVTANAHSARAALAWEDSPGRGLGDQSDATVGGYLAGARGV